MNTIHSSNNGLQGVVKDQQGTKKNDAAPSKNGQPNSTPEISTNTDSSEIAKKPISTPLQVKPSEQPDLTKRNSEGSDLSDQPQKTILSQPETPFKNEIKSRAPATEIPSPHINSPELNSKNNTSEIKILKEIETEKNLSQNNKPQAQQQENIPVVKEAISKLNNYMKSLQRNLEFNYDEDSGRTIIKVIDKSTNEVVRVLPPEETVEIAKGLTTGKGDLGAIIDMKT